MVHREQQPKDSEQAWSTPQFDRRRTGYGGGGAPAGEPSEPVLRFEAISSEPPAVVDGVVFTATGDGTVRADDIESGERCWECAVGGEMNANVSVADGRVFGGTRHGRVFAIDANTGELDWTFAADDHRPLEFTAKPTTHDGVVYIPCRGNGTLYALDAATGGERWAFKTDHHALACPPVVSDGVIYVGNSDGDFVAINAEHGFEVWRREGRGRFETAPAAADGLIVANSDPNLHAFDAETGEQVWRSTNTHYGAPTIADGVVYAGSRDGVTGYDIDTGDEVFTMKNDAHKHFSPAIADGVLYVATADETIIAVDAETKAQLWEYETDERVESAVVVADDAVFAVDGADGGTLYVLTDGTGSR
jgi:outer membrane protein assembly factor BamB